MSSNQISPAFLQESLSSILSSPHISFPKPPAGLPNIRLGHGPVDLFSTRFANTFASDAKGVVAGKEVDRDALKAALLALQKRWQEDTVKFDEQQSSVVSVAFTWTPRKTTDTAQVKASATIGDEGGAPRIKTLNLDGEAGLFETQ
ncbi:hypothetical protein BXZ70DRAFT_900445 [Cristinia sonorae]|uniref:Uncharacterized protein n=1 Tax=Cristinia sonorae TaxID=1940300 RepID=A0A8K0UHG1_9AGAR|nr:hypothetical protein BXZ70DRAFT_900445 [Cristinia sonorae]